MKFHGSYEALRDKVLRIGINGEWRDLGNQKQYRAHTGAILNWWQSTGTIFCQGNAAAAAEFKEQFLSAMSGLIYQTPTPQRDKDDGARAPEIQATTI